MKINPSNFLQINKTGHNLLSIFVVLSLIFNPLLPHIPVAEAAKPDQPAAPTLVDGEDDSRNGYTDGETDGKIKGQEAQLNLLVLKVVLIILDQVMLV